MFSNASYVSSLTFAPEERSSKTKIWIMQAHKKPVSTTFPETKMSKTTFGFTFKKQVSVGRWKLRDTPCDRLGLGTTLAHMKSKHHVHMRALPGEWGTGHHKNPQYFESWSPVDNMSSEHADYHCADQKFCIVAQLLDDASILACCQPRQFFWFGTGAQQLARAKNHGCGFRFSDPHNDSGKSLSKDAKHRTRETLA